MKLVIGGAYQGKRSYASEQYGILEEEWLDGNTCCEEDLMEARAVYDFHKCIQKNEKLEYKIDELCRQNPNIVIVTTEVGAGVVPMNAQDRIWRERCGRICTRLAKEADEVVRICCGIGQRIKG